MKPEEEFNVDRHRKYGRTSKCRACKKLHNKAKYAENPEMWKEATRRRRAIIAADPELKKQEAFKRKLRWALS